MVSLYLLNGIGVSMNKFNFIFKGNIYFGIKSRNSIDDIIKDKDYKSACMINNNAS